MTVRRRGWGDKVADLRAPVQGAGRPLGTAGWGLGRDGEWGAGYQLLWAPMPRVLGKALKEILESTCQRLVYFRTQMV